MPCVAGRPDLEFMITDLTASSRTIPRELVNLPRKHRLPYGAVTDLWRPSNMGNQYFSSGGFWESEHRTLRHSFAADGDVYGHDEAVLYTRSPIVIIENSGSKADDRFLFLQPGTVIRDTTWLELKGSVLQGSFISELRREDAIRMDKEGFLSSCHELRTPNPGDA
jgi:hypothetical protein